MQDARRAPRGRDRDQHIALLSERPHLALEHALVAVIIADRGEGRGVRGQGEGRKPGAVISESAHQFGGQMLCIRGTAAIPGKQQLAAVGERGHACRSHAGDQSDEIIVRGHEVEITRGLAHLLADALQ